MDVPAALRYLRFVWSATTNRDRAAMLVTLWFGALTLVSLMYSSGTDALVKLCWLGAFGVICWGQVGAVHTRAAQAALTEVLLKRIREVSPDVPQVFQFADMEHTFVSGRGWEKVNRE